MPSRWGRRAGASRPTPSVRGAALAIGDHRSRGVGGISPLVARLGRPAPGYRPTAKVQTPARHRPRPMDAMRRYRRREKSRARTSVSLPGESHSLTPAHREDAAYACAGSCSVAARMRLHVHVDGCGRRLPARCPRAIGLHDPVVTRVSTRPGALPAAVPAGRIRREFGWFPATGDGASRFSNT